MPITGFQQLLENPFIIIRYLPGDQFASHQAALSVGVNSTKMLRGMLKRFVCTMLSLGRHRGIGCRAPFAPDSSRKVDEGAQLTRRHPFERTSGHLLADDREAE
jgi:hypothetical protein